MKSCKSFFIIIVTVHSYCLYAPGKACNGRRRLCKSLVGSSSAVRQNFGANRGQQYQTAVNQIQNKELENTQQQGTFITMAEFMGASKKQDSRPVVQGKKTKRGIVVFFQNLNCNSVQDDLNKFADHNWINK